MYVSVNERSEIKQVGVSTNPSLTSLFIRDDENNPFKDWTEAKICCYKVAVSNGIVMMMTPYVDSRLIEHFDRLNKIDNATDESLTDTQMAMCDNYEDFMDYTAATDEALETGNTQITDLEMAVCDLYELIVG